MGNLDIDCPRVLGEPPGWPAMAGIVGDDHHRQAGRRSERRAAPVELAASAGRHSSAFREQRHEHAACQSILALLDQLPQGEAGIRTIDGDRLHQGESPPPQGNAKQFALDQGRLGGDERLCPERFPVALVLDQEDARLRWDVLTPRDPPANAAGNGEPAESRTSPPADDEVVAASKRKAPADEHRQRRPEGRPDDVA